MGRAALLLLLMLGSAEIFAGNPSLTFTLRSHTGAAWEISYTPSPRGMTEVEIAGKKYMRFNVPAHEKPGSPDLPSDACMLGIPENAEVSAELLEPEYESLGQILLAPAPSFNLTEEYDAIEKFSINETAYKRNSFLPHEVVSVESPVRLRHQRIATLRIRPYQYNPVTGELRRILRATLRVTLKRINATIAHHAATHDPHFQEMYKGLLLNYEEAKAYRSVTPPASPQSDPTRTWFETGRQYYKIPISADGWYKTTRSQLQAAGADVGSLIPSTIKVFQRGVQLPIVVRGDTTIEFFARRNYGDSSYTDFFTDTSACWITWGGGAGLRFTPSAVSGVPLDSLTSAATTKHNEVDTDYFWGATTAEVIDNGTIPGEGWFWTRLNVNAQVNYNFQLDTIDNTRPTATIRARVWGTAYVGPPSSPYSHRARFWLNDSLAGDFTFPQRQGGIFTATIPASWLKPGNNTLRVRNVDSTFASTFYFDWFEVEYSRKLRATQNQLLFSLNGSGLTKIRLMGFSFPPVEVFDLTTNRTITNLTISGDSVSGYEVTFSDTLGGSRTYMSAAQAVGTTIQLAKQFKDIRANVSGADYIVIAHSAFMTQAQQLATHRASRNGVRTAVIDVDDIYDEFNYGVKNGTRIKAFLRYAYDFWPVPRPAYLLFVGDASWDYKRLFSVTSKRDFIPAYGVPSGDNWYGCFDSLYSFLPQMMIGRLPVESATTAQIVVNKIISQDSYPVGEWNKNILFITGGNTPTEQAGFNYLAESAISTYIQPPPLGGTPIRVYKTTAGWIDGENKQKLKKIVKDGVSFIAFTGHSGGRVWGVDMGHPTELENTNGRLPFVSTVTCNVGGFSNPVNNVLAEDFLNADNRGAIAVWASSSLGYSTYGAALTNYWLHHACFDTVRTIGKLTTYALNRLWTETGSGYITLAMMNLNPLVGDPLSQFPVPVKPDLAITSADIGTTIPRPTPTDSLVTIRLMLRNYGLVPHDSVGVSLTDIAGGESTVLLNNKKVRRTFHVDSLFYQWKATSATGLHTLSATLDPLNGIAELNELNNSASTDTYIYTNNVFVVRPLNNAVLPAGAQRLVVTSPIGYDAAGFVYEFELDTVETFSSSAVIRSGAITPGPVTGEWTTPALALNRLYFWRARTVHGSLQGNWVTSAFTTSTELPVSHEATAQAVRWKENTPRQFSRGTLRQVAATDSGVTIAASTPMTIYARSVGFRYNQTQEYYSQLQVNDQRVIGFWWELGSSFMAIRVNAFTGTFEFKNFNTASNAALSDSMKNFINLTPVGHYIAIAVIFNGQTNVTEELKLAMDTLGATLFRSILNGQSYAFIGRKGSGTAGMIPLERLTNDTAVVSLAVPNHWSLGTGSITSLQMPVPTSWRSIHWRRSGDFTRVQARVALLGIRPNGMTDTLRLLPHDSTDVLLDSLTSQTSGPRYAVIKLAGLLATSDATTTPVLSDWWVDFVPPPDLAVSAQTVGLSPVEASSFQLPVTVHNIGYAKSDSVRVTLNALDKYNRSRQVASVLLDSIEIDGSRATTVSFSTAGMARRTRLEVIVNPVRKTRDLIVENNTAYYILQLPVIVPIGLLRVYADGKEIMDQDYVSPTPTLTLRTRYDEGEEITAEAVEMYINNRTAESSVAARYAVQGATQSRTGELMFTPQLVNGMNELKFKVSRLSAGGAVDTLEHTLNVHVDAETRILNVFNYPNPFAGETKFTFIITGQTVPEFATVKIFTVGGRKIRELPLHRGLLQIGMNQIAWDGRDEDGDEIANGYYLYQVTIGREGKSVSSMQKLAKVR